MSLRAGEGIGTSGVCGIAAGEGLARLDDGALTASLFLLNKEGLEMKSSNNENKISKGYRGRLIVAVFSGGVSSFAQR
jgi:hypothetical protein